MAIFLMVIWVSITSTELVQGLGEKYSMLNMVMAIVSRILRVEVETVCLSETSSFYTPTEIPSKTLKELNVA